MVDKTGSPCPIATVIVLLDTNCVSIGRWKKV
jgi:hypothetical protein